MGLNSLLTLSKAVSKRVSSYDHSGGNHDCRRIEAADTYVMGNLPGAGIIRHIWITISSKDPLFRRNLSQLKMAGPRRQL